MTSRVIDMVNVRFLEIGKLLLSRQSAGLPLLENHEGLLPFPKSVSEDQPTRFQLLDSSLTKESSGFGVFEYSRGCKGNMVNSEMEI